MRLVVLLMVFLRPLVLWLLALSAFLFIKFFVADSFSNSTYLVGLAEVIQSNAIWIALMPFSIGTLIFIQRLQLLYWWSTEPNHGCDFCGSPVDEKTGRYGPYRKCFLCGKTKKGWQ